MTDLYISSLVHKYRSTDLVVDTNLLILYAVGSHDPTLIPKFKRTAQFDTNDFYTLKLFLGYFNSILTTPNILTEVSDLSSSLNSQLNNKLFPSFHTTIQELTEKFVTSQLASAMPSFARFGLADSVIVELGSQNYLVLTDDLPLCSYLQGRNIDVINFNHIRSQEWL